MMQDDTTIVDMSVDFKVIEDSKGDPAAPDRYIAIRHYSRPRNLIVTAIEYAGARGKNNPLNR
jgi:hypothetical protein